MRAVLAIYKKEVKGFLLSPSFYIVCFLCAALLSWMFPIFLQKFVSENATQMFRPDVTPQDRNIHYGVFLRYLSSLNIILVVFVPALTMRLLTEEKKMRTFDLLLTSPITSAQIVAGKYLAALTAVFTLCLIGFLYPVSMVFFTKLQWPPLLIAFGGVFLLGALYAAMNLFASAMTDSAIVAYLLAALLNFSVWFVGMGVDIVDGPVIRQVFEHISLSQHLVSLVQGTVRTSSLIFFASIIFLFCFLCERVVEALRWR